jgi:hypothetical protein
MYPKKLWQPRRRNIIVVAPAGESTWAVAFSRRLIPGALFTTRTAAVVYASILAGAAGLDPTHVRVLGAA